MEQRKADALKVREQKAKALAEAGVSRCLTTFHNALRYYRFDYESGVYTKIQKPLVVILPIEKTVLCGKPWHSAVGVTDDLNECTCSECLVMLDWGLETGIIELLQEPVRTKVIDISRTIEHHLDEDED